MLTQVCVEKMQQLLFSCIEAVKTKRISTEFDMLSLQGPRKLAETRNLASPIMPTDTRRLLRREPL